MVSKVFLPTDWTKPIRPERYPGLTTATNTSVRVYDIILMHVRIGYLIFRAWFGIVHRLAVTLPIVS